jgi:hypothetical protein
MYHIEYYTVQSSLSQSTFSLAISVSFFMWLVDVTLTELLLNFILTRSDSGDSFDGNSDRLDTSPVAYANCYTTRTY